MKESKRVKINKAKICSIFSIIMVSLMFISIFGSNVYGQINPDAYSITKFAEAINKMLSAFNALVSSGFAGIANILCSIAIFVVVTFSVAFTGATGSIFPSPNNIVFNRVAIFDVNFFNPNSASLISKAVGTTSGSNVILQLFNTFQTIAVSIFILAAMITAIKLALSTLASDKAACKKAIISWVTGIIVLFLIRLIVAAIFELNEVVVWKISELAGKPEFAINIFKSLPLVGNTVSNVLFGIIGFVLGDGAAETVQGWTSINVPGFEGLILQQAAYAYGGDIFSAVCLFVIMGQTITLMVVYAKRLMYSIVLGVMAPIVVTIDTIGKILKGNSNVLSNWFKEFTGVVFAQIFHSIAMALILLIVSNVTSMKNTSFTGIVTIILISSLIKFEKLYKQILGISDGMLGQMRGQAAKVMGAVKGTGRAVREVVNNGKKIKEGYDGGKKALESIQQLKTERGEKNYNSALNNISLAAMAEKDPEKRNSRLKQAKEMLEKAQQDGKQIPVEVKENIKKLEKLERMSWDRNSEKSSNTNRTENRYSNEFANEFTRKSTIEEARNERNLRNRNFVASNSTNSSINLSNNATSNQAVNSFQNASNSFAGASSNTSYNSNNTEFNTKNVNNSSENSNSQSEQEIIAKEILKSVQELQKEAKRDRMSDTTSIDKKISEQQKEYIKSTKTMGAGMLAAATAPINIPMGLGLGLGVGDEITENFIAGSASVVAADKAAELLGGKIAESVASSAIRGTKEAVKQAYKNFSVNDM